MVMKGNSPKKKKKKLRGTPPFFDLNFFPKMEKGVTRSK
jgi:hypothetical protein